MLTLRGARLVDATMDISSGDITISGTHIEAVGQMHNAVDQVIDVVDSIVMPGFIDVHTHGGGGFNLHTDNAAEIYAYSSWVPATGVTSFLIGIVGIPGDVPSKQIKTAAHAISQYDEQEKKGAAPLGIHLEGPYINVKRRGAHLPSWLRAPSEVEAEHVLTLAAGNLRLITLAPELPGASAMIRRMLEAGVTVSMGHTDADYEQACEAIQMGVTHVTHCFNAMRPIHHHSPGLIEAIVEARQIQGELIADGVHVHPATMNVLVKLLGPQRIIVITDALAAAGMPNGAFEFAGQTAQILGGAARLSDGTLTGSVLTMDQALRNMLQITKVSLPEAVGMLTINPARSIKAAECKGVLRQGFDADLLIFDTSLNLQATLCRGSVAFATDVWRERLTWI